MPACPGSARFTKLRPGHDLLTIYSRPLHSFKPSPSLELPRGQKGKIPTHSANLSLPLKTLDDNGGQIMY